MRNLLFIILLIVPVSLFAQDFPKKSNRLVTDYTSTLSHSDVEKLEELLLGYETESSVQIAIVLMKTLDGHPIADYSVSLFNKWNVGQEGLDNGVLILLSIEERDIWITTGYGMESSLTDALSRRIIENEMLPRFKTGDYAGGLQAGSEAIILATRGEYQGNGNQGKENPGPIILLVLGVIAIFWLFFWGIAAVEAKRYAKVNGLSFLAAWALLNASRRSHSGSYGSFTGGSGGFSGGGGGGFGGFGGGFSGGGGAGGSW